MSIELKVRYYPNVGGEGGKGVKKEEILTLRVSNLIYVLQCVMLGAEPQ